MGKYLKLVADNWHALGDTPQKWQQAVELLGHVDFVGGQQGPVPVSQIVEHVVEVGGIAMDVDFGEAQTWTPLFTHKLGKYAFGFHGQTVDRNRKPPPTDVQNHSLVVVLVLLLLLLLLLQRHHGWMDGCRDVGLIELVAGFGFDGPSKGGYQSPFGGSNSDRPFKFAGAIFSPASNSTNHQVK
ncbi:hypothetical protein T03_16360 [Trichinella britovi]|uniref:Uncharacterized protein n=1 Tax=Trichinella britovi TaxID=45882 RepID=A0A0V1CX62_TRIBR|nr:hypothetical protein T03_16360 [Trichinella britovi]